MGTARMNDGKDPGPVSTGVRFRVAFDGWWISRMPTNDLVLVDGSTVFTSSLDGDIRVRQLTTRCPTYHRGYIAAARSQCWKHSWHSMRFADGRFALPPIAMCETRGRYVLALDCDKQQVDALTSNVGHLLWSGIVPAERSRLIADQVVGEQFTGWGIRTMGDAEAAYSPIEYHNGCVWPHDTALVAEGLRRAGALEEAARVACALLDAAREFAGQLPEVLAGFDRGHTRVPVEYPSASRPQAFAAGAPLLVLRTMLGLDPADDPRPGCGSLPGMGAIRLEHVHIRGEALTFSA
jgi:glycogen debranching enzyme